MNGVFTKWRKVSSGVPQGSIIGPFMSLLYVNDVTGYVENNTSIAIFADDLKIWNNIRREDQALLQSSIIS